MKYENYVNLIKACSFYRTSYFHDMQYISSSTRSLYLEHQRAVFLLRFVYKFVFLKESHKIQYIFCQCVLLKFFNKSRMKRPRLNHTSFLQSSLTLSCLGCSTLLILMRSTLTWLSKETDADDVLILIPV